MPSSMLAYTRLLALAEGMYAEQTVRRMLSEREARRGSVHSERTEVYDVTGGMKAAYGNPMKR